MGPGQKCKGRCLACFPASIVFSGILHRMESVMAKKLDNKMETVDYVGVIQEDHLMERPK